METTRMQIPPLPRRLIVNSAEELVARLLKSKAVRFSMNCMPKSCNTIAPPCI
ncbi:MAG: hypothetical protein FWD35_01885 [Oscillospiraceae bacterium]|nr:hypothetical protein [Oscillospiraceae bacterium]